MSMNHSHNPPAPLEPETGARRMSHAEAVMLCRYAKAACPQQAFDQYTPDAWSDLLGDLRFVDCQEALRDVVKRQPFVSPAEIRAEVKRVRSKRISDYGPIEVPDGLNPEDYHHHITETMRAIGDGELLPGDTPPTLAIVKRRAFELPKGRSINEGLAADPGNARARARAEMRAGRAAAQERPKPERPTPPQPVCEAVIDDTGEGVVICERPATGTADHEERPYPACADHTTNETEESA